MVGASNFMAGDELADDYSAQVAHRTDGLQRMAADRNRLADSRTPAERVFLPTPTPFLEHVMGGAEELTALELARGVAVRIMDGPDVWDPVDIDNFWEDAHRQVVVNPKEIAGSRKPATWSVMPRWIMLLVGRVMSVGAAKYGAFNYRESAISASIYQDALERHLGLWFDGEDDDAETGVSHLASAIASCALLLDAQATGKLNDDRQKTGLFRARLDHLEGLLVTLPLPARKAS